MNPNTLSASIVIREHAVMPDGTPDPRGTLVRSIEIANAGVKVEEVFSNGQRALTVVVAGLPKPDLAAEFGYPRGSGMPS